MINPKSFFNIIILTFTIAIGFALPNTNLAKYDLEIAATLFIFFYLSKHIFFRHLRTFRIIESTTLTLVVLLTVNTTGGVKSPFFFLVYFLLFSLSLLEAPEVSLGVAFVLIFFYLFSLPPSPEFKTLLPIFSLAFITPFSLYLGKEYLEIQTLKRKESLEQEDFLLFLSLKIKKQLNSTLQLLEETTKSPDVKKIKNKLRKVIKLIDKYEAQF